MNLKFLKLFALHFAALSILVLSQSCSKDDTSNQIDTNNNACGSDSSITETISTANTKNVLFIGNSYTSLNNLPNIIRQIALSVNDTLNYNQHTPGGASLSQHASDITVANKIKTKRWDYVTIQSQSLESVLSQHYFNTNVYPSALKLVSKIKSNCKTTTPLFFMTWGYKGGVPSYCNELPYICSYETMSDKLQERYTYYASSTYSSVSPVGVVWKRLRASYPNVELFASDGNHPSVIGSYAAAYTFYTMIFEKDPSLLTYNDPSVDDTVERNIKRIVKTVVFEHIADWKF